jgi:hypothetical protein
MKRARIGLITIWASIWISSLLWSIFIPMTEWFSPIVGGKISGFFLAVTFFAGYKIGIIIDKSTAIPKQEKKENG